MRYVFGKNNFQLMHHIKAIFLKSIIKQLLFITSDNLYNHSYPSIIKASRRFCGSLAAQLAAGQKPDP